MKKLLSLAIAAILVLSMSTLADDQDSNDYYHVDNPVVKEEPIIVNYQSGTFYIRIDGQEVQGFGGESKTLYTDGIEVEKVLRDPYNTNDLDEISDILVTKRIPTSEEVTSTICSKFDLDFENYTYYVRWYVVKYDSSDGWHIDGVLKSLPIEKDIDDVIDIDEPTVTPITPPEVEEPEETPEEPAEPVETPEETPAEPAETPEEIPSEPEVEETPTEPETPVEEVTQPEVEEIPETKEEVLDPAPAVEVVETPTQDVSVDIPAADPVISIDTPVIETSTKEEDDAATVEQESQTQTEDPTPAIAAADDDDDDDDDFVTSPVKEVTTTASAEDESSPAEDPTFDIGDNETPLSILDINDEETPLDTLDDEDIPLSNMDSPKTGDNDFRVCAYCGLVIGIFGLAYMFVKKVND